MVLPRLYLLITVGGVYIKSRQAPAKDILKVSAPVCCCVCGARERSRGYRMVHAALCMRPCGGADVRCIFNRTWLR